MFVPEPEPKSEESALKRIMERCQAAPTAYENWAPAVEKAGVSSPATRVVPLTTALQLSFLDGYPETQEMTDNLDQIVQAVEEMGKLHGFPLFIKTSFTSNKHYWEESCCLASADRETVIKHIGEIVFYQGMSPYPFSSSLLIRQMLETEAAFHAFGNMPVTKEFRFFAGHGQVEGYQPYWPKEAIKGHAPTAKDWEQKLEAISALDDKDFNQLEKMAKAITRHLDGDWSVDFLQDRHGKWWLIDMAEARMSYRNVLGFKTIKKDDELSPQF
jgi:hypothetical protein